MKNAGGPHEASGSPKIETLRAVLELRAVGFGYPYITRETGVPTSTAHDWCQAHAEELGHLREDALERLEAAAGGAVSTLVAATRGDDASLAIKAAGIILTNLARIRRATAAPAPEADLPGRIRITGLSDEQAAALAAALDTLDE